MNFSNRFFSRREKSYEHVDCNCNKPAKIFPTNCKKITAESLNLNETLRFLHQSIFLIKTTLWRSRMQFLQPRREFFNIRSKKIAEWTKMIKSYSIFQWSVFMGTMKAVFTTSSKSFRRRAKKISPTVPKGKLKQYFFLKISFWKNVRMGTKKAFFTTSLTVFRQNAKTFN